MILYTWTIIYVISFEEEHLYQLFVKFTYNWTRNTTCMYTKYLRRLYFSKENLYIKEHKTREQGSLYCPLASFNVIITYIPQSKSTRFILKVSSASQGKNTNCIETKTWFFYWRSGIELCFNMIYYKCLDSYCRDFPCFVCPFRRMMSSMINSLFQSILIFEKVLILYLKKILSSPIHSRPHSTWFSSQFRI